MKKQIDWTNQQEFENLIQQRRNKQSAYKKPRSKKDTKSTNEMKVPFDMHTKSHAQRL